MFLLIFRERRRERKSEKHWLAASFTSCMPPNGNGACSLGMCPDLELNQRPLGVQDNAQPTEAHQPGPFYCKKDTYIIAIPWCAWKIKLCQPDINHIIALIKVFNQPAVCLGVNRRARWLTEIFFSSGHLLWGVTDLSSVKTLVG